MGLEVWNPVGSVARAEATVSGQREFRTVRTLGLLHNEKMGGDVILQRLAERVQADHGQLRVIFRAKANASLPCPPEILDELAASCDAALVALGD